MMVMLHVMSREPYGNHGVMGVGKVVGMNPKLNKEGGRAGALRRGPGGARTNVRGAASSVKSKAERRRRREVGGGRGDGLAGSVAE